jgi:anti-anti-sigma factor
MRASTCHPRPARRWRRVLRRLRPNRTESCSVGRTGALEIRTHRSGRACSIEVLGALNQITHVLLAEVLEQALERDADTIVVDLTGLEAIDHAGIRVILIAHERASDQQKRLLIVPSPDAVQRVLDAVHGPFSYTSRAPPSEG